MAFEVRIRNWWRPNSAWPNGLEPHMQSWARARKLGTFDTAEEARACCRVYNDTHKPGRLSRKAEYREIL
jgi:hypothetical protein